MIIGAFHIHLHLPMAHSLKEKRGYLKGLVIRLSKKHNISISEIDNQDDWHNAVLGMSCVSSERKIIESTFRKVLDEIEAAPGVELETYEEEYF